jgi:hypothetical protein
MPKTKKGIRITLRIPEDLVAKIGEFQKVFLKTEGIELSQNKAILTLIRRSVSNG